MRKVFSLALVEKIVEETGNYYKEIIKKQQEEINRIKQENKNLVKTLREKGQTAVLDYSFEEQELDMEKILRPGSDLDLKKLCTDLGLINETESK